MTLTLKVALFALGEMTEMTEDRKARDREDAKTRRTTEGRGVIKDGSYVCAYQILCCFIYYLNLHSTASTATALLARNTDSLCTLRPLITTTVAS